MLWGESLSLPFPASRGFLHFLPVAPSSNNVLLSPPDTAISLIPFPTLKAYCDGPTQIIQHNLPNLCSQLISNLDSLCNLSPSLTCSLIYSQEPGIRLWTSLGGHYPAYHIILPIKGFIITHNKKSRSERLQEGSGCATPSYTRSYVSLLNRLHRASLSRCWVW